MRFGILKFTLHCDNLLGHWYYRVPKKRRVSQVKSTLRHLQNPLFGNRKRFLRRHKTAVYFFSNILGKAQDLSVMEKPVAGRAKNGQILQPLFSQTPIGPMVHVEKMLRIANLAARICPFKSQFSNLLPVLAFQIFFVCHCAILKSNN
jgi:hypothetical protein